MTPEEIEAAALNAHEYNAKNVAIAMVTLHPDAILALIADLREWKLVAQDAVNSAEFATKQWSEVQADLRAAQEALAAKYAFQVPEHLGHMTDGGWHDTCGYCLTRRGKGGTGVIALDEARAENDRLKADLRAKTEALERFCSRASELMETVKFGDGRAPLWDFIHDLAALGVPE